MARAALVDTLTTQVTHDTEIVGARIAEASAETTGDVARRAERLSGAPLLSLRPGADADAATHACDELTESFEILLATRPEYTWIAYSDLVDRGGDSTSWSPSTAPAASPWPSTRSRTSS